MVALRGVWVGLALGALAVVASAASAAPSGTVLAVVQSAEIDGQTGQQLLQVEAPVYAGDRIITGLSGEAQVKFRDDTKLVVGPNSSMVIDAFVFNDDNTARQISINALRGAFRFITGNSRKDAYSITTPTATIGVRGTEFDFDVDSAETRVALFEGATRICTRRPADGTPEAANWRQHCIVQDDPCSVSITPEDQNIRQVKSIDDRNKNLSDFRYVHFQGGLRQEFRVSTKSCGDISVAVPFGSSPLPTPPPTVVPPPPPPPPPCEPRHPYPHKWPIKHHPKPPHIPPPPPHHVPVKWNGFTLPCPKWTHGVDFKHLPWPKIPKDHDGPSTEFSGHTLVFGFDHTNKHKKFDKPNYGGFNWAHEDGPPGEISFDFNPRNKHKHLPGIEGGASTFAWNEDGGEGDHGHKPKPDGFFRPQGGPSGSFGGSTWHPPGGGPCSCSEPGSDEGGAEIYALGGPGLHIGHKPHHPGGVDHAFGGTPPAGGETFSVASSSEGLGNTWSGGGHDKPHTPWNKDKHEPPAAGDGFTTLSIPSEGDGGPGDGGHHKPGDKDKSGPPGGGSGFTVQSVPTGEGDGGSGNGFGGDGTPDKSGRPFAKDNDKKDRPSGPPPNDDMAGATDAGGFTALSVTAPNDPPSSADDSSGNGANGDRSGPPAGRPPSGDGDKGENGDKFGPPSGGSHGASVNDIGAGGNGGGKPGTAGDGGKSVAGSVGSGNGSGGAGGGAGGKGGGKPGGGGGPAPNFAKAGPPGTIGATPPDSAAGVTPDDATAPPLGVSDTPAADPSAPGGGDGSTSRDTGSSSGDTGAGDGSAGGGDTSGSSSGSADSGSSSGGGDTGSAGAD